MIFSAALFSSIIDTSMHPDKQKVEWGKFDASILIEVKRGEDIFTCSGVLIESDVVLTAAHCVDGITSGRIIFDHKYDPSTKNFVEIIGHVIHPGYNKKVSNYAHDIALVFLEKSVSHIVPATINWNPKLKNISKLERIGFGGRHNQNVRTWTNPVYSQLESNGSVVSFKDEYSVIGDSGGPIYHLSGNRPELVAIHSTLEGEHKTYGVYLPFYKNWIEKYL